MTKTIEVSSGEVVKSIHEHDDFNHTSDEITPESIPESKPAAQQSLPNHECSGNNLGSSNSVVAHTADTVDIPGSDNSACGTTIVDKTYSLSSESCSDVAGIDQVTDSGATHVQLDVFSEEEIEFQPARTSDDDMQLVAMACYETVMEMVKNQKYDDSLILDNGSDAETLQQSKPVNLDVLLEEERRIPQSKPSKSPDANMQYVAMACYETVMEMVRSDDALSSSVSDKHQLDDNCTSAQLPLLDSQHLHNVQQYSQERHVTAHHPNVVNILHNGHATKQVGHHSNNVQLFSHANHLQHSEGVELPLIDDGTVDSLQKVVVTNVQSDANNGLVQAASQLVVTENVTPSDDPTVVVNKKPPQSSSCK